MAHRGAYRFAHIACLCILGAAIVLVAGCGSRRSEQARAQGDIHLRLMQYDQAEAAFRRAFDADPTNALALVGLGRTETARGNFEEALRHFDDAISVSVETEEAHIEKAYTLDRLGREAEALAAAQRLTAFAPVSAAVLEANLLNRQQRSGEAQTLLQQTLEAYPGEESLAMALAFTRIRLGELASAEAAFRSVLDTINPDSTAARMGLVEVYRRQGELPAAVDEMRQYTATRRAAWQESPGSRALELRYIGAQLQLALGLIELDAVDEAAELAEPIYRENREMPWANFVMGSVHLARDEITDAVAALQFAAASLPDEPIVQDRLAIAQAGGPRRAGVRAPAPAAPARDIVGAQAALPDPAALDARPVGPVALPAMTDWETLWQTGNLLRLLGGRDQILARAGREAREVLVLAALFTFNDALAISLAEELPADNPVRAYAEAMVDRDAEALKAIVEAWEPADSRGRVNRENARGFMLARIGLRGAALEALSGIGQAEPNNVVAFYNLAAMYNGLGMPRLAGLTLQRLLARYPQSLEPRILLFETLERDGRREDARVVAETTHALYPDEPRVLVQLADAYASLNNLPMAETVLSSGVSNRPADEELRVALAVLQHRGGDLEAAAETLSNHPETADRTGLLATAQATIAALAGDWESAAAYLEEVTSANRSAAAWSLAISAAIRLGEDPPTPPAMPDREGMRLWPLRIALGEAAQQAPVEVVALGRRLAEDSDSLAAYAFGLACAIQRLYAPAADAFEAVRAALPGEPFLVTQLMSTLQQGVEVADRSARARQIAEAERSLPAAWLGLARLQEAMGDPSAQRQALAEGLQNAPGNHDLLRARAAFAEAEGDIALALASYETLLTGGAEDAAVFNNYAYYLLRTGGDLDAALNYATRASELLQTSPQVRHTLGLAQLRQGMLEEARRNLGAALEMMPSDPTLLLDYGHLLLEEGEEEQGRQSIQLAIRYADQLGVPFDRRTEAESLLTGS